MYRRLTLGYSYKERPNLYYPLLDPKTGVAYPSNPDRVWVYASESRLKEGQTVQAKTMEEFIAIGQIIFPSAEQRVETWPTMEVLLAAIDAVDVPKSGKPPLLRRDLPNLEFWVGRPCRCQNFGDRAFNYAKPLSLIKNLLQQVTRPGDIVLDFFAGSGTQSAQGKRGSYRVDCRNPARGGCAGDD